MTKRGIGIIGVILFIGLVAVIAWGLNYIITKDYVVVRPATVAIPSNTLPKPQTTIAVTQTPTSTPIKTTTSATTTKATSTPPKTTPAPTTPAPSTSSGLTITFTDSGFSPASLTVKKGDTVKFVNNSDDKMWVAANPFPTSSEYPAFTSKTGIAAGSSWSFTFDKTGTWFYHNHFSPPQGGKIVVNAK